MNTHFENRETHPQLRIDMLKSMNTIARSINNESLIHIWLTYGVEDGDLTDEQLFNDYGDDKTFADIMALFCRLMRYVNTDDNVEETDRNKGNGLLFCDWVESKMLEN